MDFKGKIVLITGASSGIGRETAIQFIKGRANVILVARRKNRLESIADEFKEFNSSIMIYQCDVSDKSQVEKMANFVLERFGYIDILVNNAGFAIYGPVRDLSIQDIQSQMETNYFGMVYCIKNFLPSMIEKNSGHIVNVASVAANFGLPGIASYCASKFAMLGFSEGLRHELAETDIGITVVSPIMVRTEFFNNPSFKKKPNYSPISLDSKTVAKAIMKASNSPRLEIIVPSFVRGAVWMKNTFPFLIDPIVRRAFKKQLKSQK
jgi:short-subunit dehydrogenase